ncbi:hypothetical protein TCON_0470 [Astathelohania contejeani]|uniref:Uncharacterized protein n=1 Tax=Astathelohania contejeani TaxID=164912 RepID=A0ABQ7I1R5_9MICR|nr:hypothetical protein TCON_0470 [Thelohania contejeani]
MDLLLNDFTIFDDSVIIEFNKFKKLHIEKLSYINDHIISLYQYAFFFYYYNLNISKQKFCKKYKIKPTLFNNALKEVKQKYKRKIEKEIKIREVFNLYSIFDA